MFTDNFIHGDLHLGNVIVSQHSTEDKKQQLVLLDAGLVVELSAADRVNLVALFKAVIENDGRKAARLMMQHPCNQQNRNDDKQQVQLLPQEQDNTSATQYEQAMSVLVNSVHKQGLSLGKLGVGSLLQQVLQLSYKHQVTLESRFVSVVVAVVLAEGMGRRLDPDLDIIVRAMPYIRSAAVSLMIE